MKKVLVLTIVMFCWFVTLNDLSAEEIEGTYYVNNSSESPIVIEKIKNNQYKLVGIDRGNTWHGIGFFDGKIYWGVWCYEADNGKIGNHGTHEATLNKDNTFTVSFCFAGKSVEKGNFIWSKQKKIIFLM